jgi:hypothetical protein
MTARVAPASTTSPTVSASMPPIANHGSPTWAAAWRIGWSPMAGRPSFVGVAWTGPTAM